MTSNSIVPFILSALLTDPAFGRCAAKHLNLDYFDDPKVKLIVRVAVKHFGAYGTPTIDQLIAGLDNSKADPELIVDARDAARDLYQLQRQGDDWFRDNAASWLNTCKQKYLTEQIKYALEDGRDTAPLIAELATPVVLTVEKISDSSRDPNFLSDMHAYFRDNRMVEFHKHTYNQMTGGGCRPGSLGVICAGTNVGKSLADEVDPKGWTNFGRRLDGAAG